MTAGYVELHAKSSFSFGVGVSHAHELLAQAKEYGYETLALTDMNLCGALEFARLANSLGVRPITGGELTLTDDSSIILLAKTRTGYSNISRLFTLANATDRRKPKLDPAHLPDHSEGVVLLAGGRRGLLSRLATDGRRGEARKLLMDYMDWYGSRFGVRRAKPQLPTGGCQAQPRACRTRPRERRAGGRLQRRSLPHP